MDCNHPGRVNDWSANLHPKKWVQVPAPMSHHDHNKTPFNGQLFWFKFSYSCTEKFNASLLISGRRKNIHTRTKSRSDSSSEVEDLKGLKL